MALFQKSVLNEYLNNQDNVAVEKAYKKFVKYFENPTTQQNIRDINEEGFQQKFLMELFVTCFGYVINPDPDYNLTTEFKNLKDAKKADGAILIDGKAIAVIELKGTNTKDLEKCRQQAFDYHSNHPTCKYVITSNFEKLRFYINTSDEFEEFNLFTLTEKEFALLYLCVLNENLLSDIPLEIKEASIQKEEAITKEFYSDYSTFKRELFRDLANLNMKNEVFRSEINIEDVDTVNKNIKLNLFKKSQKLIDRFLFIFFGEDRGLLPSNSTLDILKKWKSDVSFGEVRPLYDIFKIYFKVLDKGREGINGKAEIFAYNGGLFKPDPILESLIISDELLYKYTKNLSNYDFDSQVDVNILGHIFENSLNEIENINAEIEGVEFDKQTSKRKKDGVFYTPKYITKYIVDNTIGKLCIEKKAEFGIIEEEYFKSRKGRPLKTLEILKNNLEAYREWLLHITILDPACGSGAFLNQALDFLIKEHQYIDELKTNLLGGGFVFPNIENTVLESNIFGVDINEESVEIAKLSLWLRTAQPRRKLNDLSSNIKCGNSLIDSKSIAGDKAFNWEDEYPHIFSNGGFDVVIGNPPYVNLERMKEVSLALEKQDFETYNKRGDLYILFAEQGFNLLKKGGTISYIMPNKWLQAGYGENLRKYFLSKELKKIIDFGDLQIFEGATTYPCIFIAKNNSPKDKFSVSVLKSTNSFDFDSLVSNSAEDFVTNQFSGDTWVISSVTEKNLLTRLENNNTLSDLFDANRGIIPGLSEAFIIDEIKKKELVSKDSNSDNIIGSILRGRDLTRYGKPNVKDLDSIILAQFGSYKYIEKEYPAIFNHLLQFKEKLKKRGQCNGGEISNEKPFTGQHHWMELDNTPLPEYLNLFSEPKIMYQVFQVKPCFTFDEQSLYCNNSMWIIPTDNKALLGVLNSKMGWWLITKYCTQIQNGCQLIWKYFGKIPIPELKNITLEERVNAMLLNSNRLQVLLTEFTKYLQSQFQLEKLTKKLQNWHELEFGDFIKELNKAIKKAGGDNLDDKAQFSLMSLFEEQREEAQTLKTEIDQTDREIDQMVYELYSLTEEEIKIVEES